MFQCSNTLCTYSVSQRKSNPTRKIQKLCPKRVRQSQTYFNVTMKPYFLRMHHGLVTVGPRASIRPHSLCLCMDNRIRRKVLATIFSEYRTRFISARSPGFTHSRSASFTNSADLPRPGYLSSVHYMGHFLSI